MRKRSFVLAAIVLGGVLLVASLAIGAGGKKNLKSGDLIGYEENLDVSTRATGAFKATLDDDARTIAYELTYRDLESDVSQAHIHFGKRAVNGGISVFLCSNLGNGPAGTPLCPLRSGSVSRTVGVAEVIGPAGQGIAAGEFDELAAAMRAGATYANVHSATFPGGEIRAQINDR
jgi:hypothetical protein